MKSNLRGKRRDPWHRANAQPKAVADPVLSGQDAEENRRCVLTWFASRWRNHQPKRAEKPHSKFNLARGWTALPRGRRLRLPWRMASGSRQPHLGGCAQCRHGKESVANSHPPICPCSTVRSGRDLSFLGKEQSLLRGALRGAPKNRVNGTNSLIGG
jgi:hypothetical protein